MSSVGVGTDDTPCTLHAHQHKYCTSPGTRSASVKEYSCCIRRNAKLQTKLQARRLHTHTHTHTHTRTHAHTHTHTHTHRPSSAHKRSCVRAQRGLTHMRLPRFFPTMLTIKPTRAPNRNPAQRECVCVCVCLFGSDRHGEVRRLVQPVSERWVGGRAGFHRCVCLLPAAHICNYRNDSTVS
jgi:hypothetical protein